MLTLDPGVKLIDRYIFIATIYKPDFIKSTKALMFRLCLVMIIVVIIMSFYTERLYVISS